MARVLIVDDAMIMRNILGVMLEKCGHEVVGTAGNADDALSLYQQLMPDFVTMDIIMDGRDGIDCLKSIRKVDPAARVIMISAQGHGIKEIEARESGAIGYVSKPIQLEALQGEVQRALASVVA